jgi:hypothetical protein
MIIVFMTYTSIQIQIQIQINNVVDSLSGGTPPYKLYNESDTLFVEEAQEVEWTKLSDEKIITSEAVCPVQGRGPSPFEEATLPRSRKRPFPVRGSRPSPFGEEALP